MRFNAQMDFHVRPYVLFQDFFAAYFADASSFSVVGFLEVVRFHVLDIAVFVRHHFVAHRTLKAEFVFRIVLGPNVIFQRFLLIFKDFSAKRAVLVPGFREIVQLLEVVLELLVIFESQIAYSADESFEFFHFGVNVRVPL